MHKNDFTAALKEIHNSAQMALSDTEPDARRMKIRLVKSFIDFLSKERHRAGIDVRQSFDRFSRMFLECLGDEQPEELQKLKIEQLKAKVDLRLAPLDLVIRRHPSPYLLRETREVCGALVRACNRQLDTELATCLGRPRIHLVR